MTSESLPIFRLQASYVCALCLIALLASAGHVLTGRLAHERESDARVVNVAGRQRMLSERLVKLLLLSRAGAVEAIDTDGDGVNDATPLTALENVLERLRTSHAALASGDAKLDIPAAEEPSLKRAYAELGDVLVTLDAELSGSLDAPTDDAALGRVIAAQTRFVHAQNAIVNRHEQLAARKHERERRTTTWLFRITLLTLCLEALFVFEPAVRTMRRLVARLLEANARASWQAMHDTLTRLPSRRALNDELERACAALARSEDARFALLFLDFDGFKAVNDGHGHDVGDALLCAIAERLRALAPRHAESGLDAYRLGGDEFVLLLQGVHAHRDAVSLADEAIAAFGSAHRLGELDIVATVSIGIVRSDPERADADEVLRDADGAMRRAKSLGKSRHVLFDRHRFEPATRYAA